MNKFKTIFLVFVAVIAVLGVGAFAVQAMPIQTTPNNTTTVTPEDTNDTGGTVTPEDPTPTIGLPTDVVINVSDPAGMQGYSFYDVNGMDVQELTIGETYTFMLWTAPNYVVILSTVNGVEVSLPYTFVADNEFNFYADIYLEQGVPVTATIDCPTSGITVYFWDEAYEAVTIFEEGCLYRIALSIEDSSITIYNVKVDGVTVYQLDESGYNLENMSFYAPSYDFMVEITTTADIVKCFYTVSCTDEHFAALTITDTGGGVEQSVICAGRTYQLNFETHAGFYVTEVYLNDELLQTYEAGGIASGSVQFTPTGDFDLRVVTVSA